MTQPDEPIRPTVEEVAALIRARTKDDAGREIGTFNDRTRPTGEEVEGIIDSALVMLNATVASIGETCVSLARECVTLTAAARIERSYWPEQVNQPASVYPQLIEERRLALEGLGQCVAGTLPGYGGNDFQTIELEVWGEDRFPGWIGDFDWELMSSG